MSVPSVAVVAINHFSPFHFSVPCIIFGDILPGQKLFDLKICAGEPGPLRSRQGFSIETSFGLDVLEQADIVIVPYWRDPAERPHQELLDALVAAHQRGALVVGLCLGTYVLAYAGLLDDRRAGTHWEFEQDFINRFPSVRLDTNALYVEDDRLVTSAGTAAGLDCCLYLVHREHGRSIANKVARRMVIPPHREGGQAQFIEQPVPLSTRDANVNKLLEYLRNNLGKVHNLNDLADYSLMSRRTFTRHFQKATGMSVGGWLMSERLQRSQELLETTSHSIETIAELVGFQSAASLRQHFKARFDVTPTEWRKTFQAGSIVT
ncbi:helix-turn-helix domain-containing protein [Geomonas nitrogeniifigens]|uniref:Helix-turn-helix domain-containing protein n=1 Tax=Geomonas diazotrophica TaxID=2843197 RepID=A0ABX8JLJ5_9BACT|nr:helix-turn-helix domain-containing protein [Geomonas nitrogeniifigens]QWV99248.1 helix-turn-helix domain-containing protein [Geomonas nitrogeniifigens]